MNKKAFTLLELLVVVAVISILFAMLMPAVGKGRDKARAVVCCNNLRQLFLAATIFSKDKGRYPRSYLPEEEPDFFSRYLDGVKDVLRCPEVEGYFNDEVPVYSYGWFWYKAGTAPPGIGTVFPLSMENDSSHVPMFADSVSTRVSNQYVGDSLNEFWGLEVVPTHPCDFNGDGRINIGDATCYGMSFGNIAFDHNGRANIIYLDGHIENVKE